jgi:hypothetical protein
MAGSTGLQGSKNTSRSCHSDLMIRSKAAAGMTGGQFVTNVMCMFTYTGKVKLITGGASGISHQEECGSS